MKDLDGTANFSVEVGDGKEGINHTLDYGDGTTVKITILADPADRKKQYNMRANALLIRCTMCTMHTCTSHAISMYIFLDKKPPLCASAGKIGSGSFETGDFGQDGGHFRRRHRRRRSGL